MTQENVNNLENNEIPKTTPEKVEQQEISQEEFLNWLDNEGNNFKQETQQELDKANSIDLDQPTFEKIKNDTGVENDLNAVNLEAEKYIDEARQLVKESESLQKSPKVLHNWDGIEGLSLSDTGEDQRKKLEEMVASGQISSEEVVKIKNEIQAESTQKLNLEQQEKQKELSDFLQETGLNIGSMATLELVYGYPASYEVDSIDKEKGNIHFKITQNAVPQALINDREAYFSGGTKGTFSLDHLRDQITKHQPQENKSENLEENKKLNIEQLIQSTSSLPELYKVIQNAGGIQGSSENYSAEQLWERVRAYVNGEAEETVITRTGGLREKVKELKFQREQSKAESKNEFKSLSYEEWRDSLPDVHLTAGFLTFRPGKESELKDMKYFVDKKGDHYVSYTETDGSKQARKLYIAANNAGISQEVDPSILG
jgi:glutamate synthase domain-containing protein 2